MSGSGQVLVWAAWSWGCSHPHIFQRPSPSGLGAV